MTDGAARAAFDQVIAIANETRAFCYFKLAQIQRLRLGLPESDPIDIGPLYVVLDLTQKIKGAAEAMELGLALKYVAELREYAGRIEKEYADVVEQGTEGRTS